MVNAIQATAQMPVYWAVETSELYDLLEFLMWLHTVDYAVFSKYTVDLLDWMPGWEDAAVQELAMYSLCSLQGGFPWSRWISN